MNKRSRSVTALASALMTVALAAAAATAAGQDNIGRGRINGQVVDEAGQPLAGARIVVRILDGTTELEGVSDKKGRFAVAGMGTGRWRITATLSGYLESFIEMPISQVRPNPPVTLTLKRTGGPAGFQADAESLAAVDRANALEAEGKLDEAIGLFEEFLAKYPGVYQVRANLAGARLKKGDIDGAEADFKAVVDQSGGAGDLAKDKVSAARGLTGLGEVALKRQDLEAAVRRFSEALALAPDDEAAAYNVGEILFSNQKIDEAIPYFELAVKIRNDWPRPHHKLGLVYLNKGVYDKALEHFKTFIALDPGNPEVPNVRNIMAAVEKMKKDGRSS